MLEELTMDKKPSNRSVQVPSKGTGTENKKDVSKQFSKTSRRREPANSNGYRSDQNRKPAPQKGKTMDKRPRPRGQLYGGGKESAQVEECEAELGSLYSTGSKKQNLNHLLNFHYAPRGETARPSPRPSHQYGVRWLMSTQKHKYNKEHFLQANCQFVVRANADYTPYLADPDHLVDWDFIEQIRVPSVEPVHCPICLSTPVAAKMTRCGHIYCYPCILHYLALSDKTWHKCPICFEAIHKQHLKRKMDGKRGYSVGQLITFQLMVRERGSLMVCPVSQLEVRTQHKPVLAVSETQLDTAFAKLLIADRAEVLAMIEQEVKELKVEKSVNEGCPELCFVEQALELCEERRLNIDQKIKEIVEEKPMEEVTENEEATNANVLSSSPDESAIVYESAFDTTFLWTTSTQRTRVKLSRPTTNRSETRYESLSSEGEDPSLTAITPEDLEVFHAHQPPTQSKNFNFYQACDGQQIYLHAVNVQMLEMTYGSLEESPATLTGVIVEKEGRQHDSTLRRRLRYLQHLPVTAQFEVAEIELRPPVITEETFSAFA
ncbi:LOW QUALITY PROTEIN: RING finger protein 10-like, partial [Homalodisca vitripennis]|uniref:LOW QUALITY PROTEIN: RING finger protein 10-like n=1 Tax=Homalodisca vitripennis TaxID=197043 RepID=UPI001EECCD73